jgi:hypothetical protein
MLKPIEINSSKHFSSLIDSSLNDISISTSNLSGSQTNLTGEVSQGTKSSSDLLDKKNQISLSNRKLTILRRVNFQDENGRPLFIIAKLVFKIGSNLNKSTKNISDTYSFPTVLQISAIYCFFNLTGNFFEIFD